MKKYLKNTAKRIIGSIYYACYKKYQSVDIFNLKNIDLSGGRFKSHA
mgnify:CR=1 FL=1